MNKQNFNNYKKSWNSDRRKTFDNKKPQERDKISSGIVVRNGNVDQAIRALKKRLLKQDFAKELAKREYYEKPSEQRKRKKAQGIKKHQKQVRDKIMRGDMVPAEKVGSKHLKGKRQLNKYREQKRLLRERDFARTKRK